MNLTPPHPALSPPLRPFAAGRSADQLSAPPRHRLSAAQVLELSLSRRAPLPDVQLNMSVREVVQMLRDDEAFSRKVLPDALVSEYPTTSSLPS